MTGAGNGDAEAGKAKEASAAPTVAPRASFCQMFRYLRGCDYLFFLIGVIFSATHGISMPLFAVFFGDSIDAAGIQCTGDNCAWKKMKPTLEQFAILAGLIFGSGLVWFSCLTYCAERQGARMRVEYFRSVLKMDTEWFDVNEPAAVPTRMASEVQAVQDAIGPKTGLAIMTMSQFFSGVTIALWYGWKLALVIAATIPLFAAVGVYLAQSMETFQGEKQVWYARAGAVVEEVLAAIRTVSAFGGEHREAERYRSKLGKAKRGGVMAGVHMGVSFGACMGLFGFIYGLAIWFATYFLIAEEGWTGGKVMQVFFAVLMGVSSLNDLGTPMMGIFTGMASAGQAFSVIDAQSKIEPKGEKKERTMAEHQLPESIKTIESIDFKDVTFNYPSRPDNTILKGLTLSFRRGQKIALVGESGSGKSTVIQLTERFYDPISGTVSVNGCPISSLPVYAWRKQIGYVGQEPVLFATSVMKNIKGVDASITDEMAISAAKQAQAFEFLDQLPKRFDTFVGTGGSQMSGGQKQRIAIARAIVKQPQILLLDEATSALDNQSEKEVQATIDKIQAETSLTTISVAHRLSTIRNSDIIYFMKMGVVQEQGSHSELMAREGDYFKLVQTQEHAPRQSVQDSPESAAVPEPALAVNVPMGRQVSHNSKPASEKPNPTTDLPDKESKLQTASSKTKQLNEDEIEQERIKQLEESGFKPDVSRVFRLGKPYMCLLPLAFLGCIMSGCVFPCEMYALSKAIQAFYIPSAGGTVDDMKDEMNPYIILFVVFGFMSFFGDILKVSCFSFFQESIVLILRDQVFKALLRQDVGFFDDPENGPAGLTTALSRQTIQVSQLVGISVGNIVGSVFALVAGLTFAFIATWELTLIVLLMIPFLVAAMSLVMVMGMGTQGHANKAYSVAGETSSEAVLNIRTVRALLAEGQSMDIFTEQVWSVANKQAAGAPKSGFAYGFGNSAFFGLFIGGFGFGAWLIDLGRINMEDMMMSMMCVMGGAMGAGMAMGFAPDAAKGKLAAYEVFRLIDRESKIDAMSPVGVHTSLGDGTIEFEDVRFTYPHRLELPILKGLNFKAASGQSVAFVGPSGSGKSTCIQLLQRFYDPTLGMVKVGGTDLRQFDITFWRQQVGYVGQEPVLFDDTLEENVRYGKPSATRAELEEAAKMANMDYVLDGKISWEDSVGPKGGKMSGGQKQRAAIARALVRKPSVLLLDEATSALDSVSERVVQEALDKAKEGRTTFIIAHRLSTIRDCDKIIVIVSGKLAEQGNHDELMQMQGVYWNLVKKGSE